jgi:hypothetical protein
MIASASTSVHLRRFHRWGRSAGLLLLAGYLVFCHGCHGEDVDDELGIVPHRKAMRKTTKEMSFPPRVSAREYEP